MDCPANDAPELDDCRALNPSPQSSKWSACSNNRRQSPSRQSSASRSSITKRARSSFNAALILLVGIALFAASCAAPAQAFVLPTSVVQPHASADPSNANSAFSTIVHNDHFMTTDRQGRAPDARPLDVESLYPTTTSSEDILHWIQQSTANPKHDDARDSQVFLNELYQRLTLQRRSADGAQPSPRSVLEESSAQLLPRDAAPSTSRSRFWKRASSSGDGLSTAQKAVYGILIPVLVLLSGLFAGLTLGYMSLDETQLQVLALQGTPKQKMYAEKIMPIRKDGHLLLTTLLIANMITNETLPIIADPLLGGGVQAVIVSIVLVVIFAELIPQSVCSRYGLVVGAKLAPLTRVVIIVLWPIAFPVSRVLHWTLGPHSGIVYRRAELKELVNMHAATSGRGDLTNDTVTIVGGALDLQEKVVKQAMTPIADVFMISIDSNLGYETLQQIVQSGHSRIPVYQEIEIPVNRGRGNSGTLTPNRGGFLSALSRKASNTQSKHSNSTDDQRTLEGSVTSEKEPKAFNADAPVSAVAGAAIAPGAPMEKSGTMTTIKRKKIIGALLVKQCVLLDPEDETPVRDMVINALPTVPADEPLLNLLNVFQEGRSHLAIVSSRTRRSSPGSFVDLGNDKDTRKAQDVAKSGTAARVENLGNIDEEKQLDDQTIKKSFWSRHVRRHLHHEKKSDSLDLPPEAMDDEIDAGAVATEMAQRDVPIGIITLEDVLEELIGEEILDEYDSEVEQNFAQISPPPSPGHKEMIEKEVEAPKDTAEVQLPSSALKLPTSPKIALPRFRLGRSASQKETDAPAFEMASTPATPIIESSAEVPTAKEADHKAEGVRFPFELNDTRDRPAVRDFGAVPRSSSRPGSRPVSPGPATGLGATEDAAIVAPRANKPIVIRHQTQDGNIATAIISENMLRGRSTALASERIASGDLSRSNTPSGTRFNRFKSTPLPGSAAVPGTPGAGAAPKARAFGKPDVGSALTEEPSSMSIASPEQLEPGEAEKELKNDHHSDDTDTL